MLKILQLLNSNKNINHYEILDFKVGEKYYYLKIKVILKNKSILHIKEFVSAEEYLYSYHWQDKNNKLICRWDNAPHYKNLKTFPHHKHLKNKVKESLETNIEEVLNFIDKVLF